MGVVDAVIDLVGGDVQSRSIPLIRKGGVLASIVSPPDQTAAERHGIRATFFTAARDRLALQQIANLIDDGTIKVFVSEDVPLARAAEALATSRAGHVRGKILLRVTEGD